MPAMRLPNVLERIGAFAAAALGSAALAQKPTPLPPIVRSVDVTITNVDVVVTDSRGRHVTGLSGADFVVKEDGVEQKVTNFYAVEEGKAVAEERAVPMETTSMELPQPKARLSMFIDNMRLLPANRARVLASLGDFIAKALGPNVEATVLTWDRHLATRGPFTSDGPFLQRILTKVADDAANGQMMLSQRSAILKELDDAVQQRGARNPVNPAQIRGAIANATAYAQELRAQVDDTLLALGVAVDQLAGMEGRKMLILATERLPQIPGVELIRAMRQALPAEYQRDIPFEADYDRREAFRALGRKAQAGGVAFYTLESRGLEPEDGIAERPTNIAKVDVGVEDFNTTAALQALGKDTGGAAATLRNDVSAPLASLGDDLTSYYSLGYASTVHVPGKPLKIDVAVHRPGLTVRTRTARVEKTPEARVADAVVSNLWFPKSTNPLHARLDTKKPVKSGKIYRLPLRFSVPYDKVTLVPEGDVARGRVVFHAAARDDTGRTSPVRTVVRDVKLATSEIASTEGKVLFIETEMDMRPGPQTLSFALTDEPTRVTSYVQIRVDPSGKADTAD